MIQIFDTILFIFGSVGLVNAAVRFDPYIDFIHWTLNKIFGCRISKLRDFLLKLFTCEDCMTFWFILANCLNPFWAGAGFILSNYISKKIDNLWT